MTHRLLPREEWHRLQGTLLWPAVVSMDPSALVMVVEDGGEIVGCAAYYPQWHLDGVWMKDTAPKVSVGRRLATLIRDVARYAKIDAVWAMATTATSRKLVASLGPITHLDCDHYEIDVRGE